MSDVDSFVDSQTSYRFKPAQDQFEDRVLRRILGRSPKDGENIASVTDGWPLRLSTYRFRNGVPILEVMERLDRTPLFDQYMEALDCYGFPQATQYVGLVFASPDAGWKRLMVLHNAGGLWSGHYRQYWRIDVQDFKLLTDLYPDQDMFLAVEPLDAVLLRVGVKEQPDE